jgi:hypothetical protein
MGTDIVILITYGSIVAMLPSCVGRTREREMFAHALMATRQAGLLSADYEEWVGEGSWSSSQEI